MLQSLIAMYREAIDSIKRVQIIQLAKIFLSQDNYREFLEKTGAK